MGKFRTHYDNLQVSEKAGQEVIRGAYKYLSQKWHPDRNLDDPESAARIMKIINDAYEVLSDPEKRREHDAWIGAQRAKQSQDHSYKNQEADTASSTFEEAGREESSAPDTDFGNLYLECHPWKRLLARMVDGLFAGFTLLAIVYIIVRINPSTAGAVLDISDNNTLYGIVALIVWVPIEAFLLSTIKSTPGKWLFGLRVYKRDDLKLSFSEALSRSAKVFVQGMGFGLPFVNFFTAYYGYKRLATTRTTLWDDSAHTVVNYHGWPMPHIVVGGIAISLFVIFIQSSSEQEYSPPISAPASPILAPPVVELDADTTGEGFNGAAFMFENKCNHPVSLVIRYQDINGAWVTDGKWKIGANESGYLIENDGSRILSNTATWYYYAETTDGSNFEWRGDDPYFFDGVIYHMIKLEDFEGDSNWTTTCE